MVSAVVGTVVSDSGGYSGVTGGVEKWSLVVSRQNGQNDPCLGANYDISDSFAKIRVLSKFRVYSRFYV